MPELPEVGAWRRQLDPLVRKFPIEKAGPAHIATLKTFDYFGELALIYGGVRQETVTATTDLVWYAINYWDFRPFVIANGVIGWKLLQGLAQMLRDAGEAKS